MSVQNPNQFAMTAFRGTAYREAQPNVISVTIDPDSVFTDFQEGTVLKLVSKAVPGIIVDAAEPGDEPYAVIPFSIKKNTYLKGETLVVWGRGSRIWAQCSEAINRGSRVKFNNEDAGTPTVAPLENGVASLGIALTQTAAAGELIGIEILPEAAAAAS